MAKLTPEQFVAKWRASTLKESAAAHQHFTDLCEMLDEPTPAEADPAGDWFCFERGATKSGGGQGWADVWKRQHCAWEYKSKGGNLDAAFAQLQRYALALENPPLLVVSDMERIRIHTNWTNSVSEVHELALDDLLDHRKRRLLKWVLSDPEQLRPRRTRQTLTEEAAGEFAKLAKRLRDRGHDPQTVAHFVNRLVFCMFAEDVDLLPGKMFRRMLEASVNKPDDFPENAGALFQAMKDGGRVGFESVDWFNGGLFDDDSVLPLTKPEIELALSAAKLDWSDIDPSIFGTLFERGLDPDKRSQLGAHYTDRDKIMQLVEPVVVQPWREEWECTRAEIARLGEQIHGARNKQTRTKALNRATELYRDYLQRLRRFVVLDPACGSGNFLFLALQQLKDLEHRAGLDAEAHGVPREFPQVGPQAVKGIELNPYAAELARVTVWIGEIQWMKRNGFDVTKQPILRPLDTIECRDAVLTDDGKEPDWPEASVIVGNPPFLGGKLLRDHLGDGYVETLFNVYEGVVPKEADLVCYWFAKAWQQVRDNFVERAGLVATNSIRGGANRRVLMPIVENGVIFDAWDDEPWVVDGAAVRVSLIAFSSPANGKGIKLDGTPVEKIYSDLTAGAVDLTRSKLIPENKGIAFMGDTKGGAFDISGDVARAWLSLPYNPNGKPNSDVLKPWLNGMDVTRRPADKWIIDFGWRMSEQEASLYETPFQYLFENVKPARAQNRRATYREYWWRHVEVRPAMWRALEGFQRYIVTPTVAKHRLFVWCHRSVVPDHQLIVIAREDDMTFGILHSRFHERWALRLGTWLGKGNDPRYTPSTTFETFPFPDGLTPAGPAPAAGAHSQADAIAEAAQELDRLRRNWLNPDDLVERVPEVVPGYPDRIVPKDERAAKELKKHTLTRLYNERPAWLDAAHRELDAAVARAYGWPEDISDEDALAELLKLNQERASRKEAADTAA